VDRTGTLRPAKRDVVRQLIVDTTGGRWGERYRVACFIAPLTTTTLKTLISHWNAAHCRLGQRDGNDDIFEALSSHAVLNSKLLPTKDTTGTWVVVEHVIPRRSKVTQYILRDHLIDDSSSQHYHSSGSAPKKLERFQTYWKTCG
jgi:hypothetical protein